VGVFALNDFSVIQWTDSSSKNFLTRFWLMMWQCYDTKFLKVYASLPPSPLQLEEDLEQLKVLENGYKLKVFFQIRDFKP